MDKVKLLYRVPEAAESLGLSRAMVNRLIARGELASVRIGAARRIPEDELRRYVERLRPADQGAAKAEEVASVS